MGGWVNHRMFKLLHVHLGASLGVFMNMQWKVGDVTVVTEGLTASLNLNSSPLGGSKAMSCVHRS